MSIRIKDVKKILDEWAAPTLAEPWDQIGLFLGDPEQEVRRIKVALGVSPEVVKEAIDSKADLLVTHHPLWMSPPMKLSEDQPIGKMVADLIRHNIGVLSAHTNLDACKEGVNDNLANILELREVTPLIPQIQSNWLKLAVFVPETDADLLQNALGDAGAGQFKNYSHCAFSTLGEGTFLPLTGAKPAIGEIGKLEKVNEARIEAIVSRENLSPVLASMLAAHPYEEVVYDLIPLENQTGGNEGLGRVGNLQTEMTLGEFADFVKTKLNLQGVRFCGEPTTKIRKVALCGGSGMSLLKEALRSGADVYLTGDIKHHDAEEALQNGICLVDGGHFGTENHILSVVVERLQKETNCSVDICSGESEIFKFC